jgi:hypothetical protein
LLADRGEQRLDFFGIHLSLCIAVLGGTDQKLGAGASGLGKQVIDIAFAIGDGDDLDQFRDKLLARGLML